MYMDTRGPIRGAARLNRSDLLYREGKVISKEWRETSGGSVASS